MKIETTRSAVSIHSMSGERKGCLLYTSYEEVWGEEYFYDDSNIMAIISRLRKKLEVNPSSPKYIQTVKGIGYQMCIRDRISNGR